MLDGTLRSSCLCEHSGFFTNVIVGEMEIVVGRVRAENAFDASRTELTTFARSSCH